MNMALGKIWASMGVAAARESRSRGRNEEGRLEPRKATQGT
jgi:hypothetical protein